MSDKSSAHRNVDEHAEVHNDITMPMFNLIKEDFSNANNLVEDVILKKYLHNLVELEIVPIDESLKNISYIRLFKITEMVYQNNEYSTYKFASVFNAVQNLSCSVFIVVDSDGVKTDFYMGVRSFDDKRTTKSLKDTLCNALIGQFPGVKTLNLLDPVAEKVLSSISRENIASVSCVAQNKNEDFTDNETFIQGLEKFALAMQGQKYTAIVLAKSTPADQLFEIRREYEKIYTQLAPFANIQLSYGTNTDTNISNGLSYAITEGRSHTESKSYQTGESYSSGTSYTNSVSKPDALGSTAKALGTVGVSVASLLAAPLTGGASLVAAGALMAARVGVDAIKPKTYTDGKTVTENSSKNYSESKGETDERNESISKTETYSVGETTGTSNNMQLMIQDKVLSDTLEKIDMQLKRINECDSIGMWECAAYFMSDVQETAEMAAGTYKALMKGEKSGVETSAINFWGWQNREQIPFLWDYITNFVHPVFKYQSEVTTIPITAASLVSSNELAIHMGLPRKSVCGFPVIQHADFGKEVVRYEQKNHEKTLLLGNVFSMGNETDNLVRLDCDSLATHTFITGSTGSGKSNTVYEMVRQLDNNGINYLIIEPAKGEYKNVFGHSYGVHVYGTNPQYTDLLRINPFRFPEGIHVLEHIDRLVEIFNVCWPMYAAMPAVLKNAIEKSYVDCGWNLVRSKNKYGDDLYPSFVDVTRNIKEIIDTSEYDSENKGAYKGSLLTRFQSLTNGIYGMIFTCDDIEDSLLFDKNVIVDLSRVGSAETKSLIMGMLVLKLQEYRMANATGMNEKLKHVTVLEEAHNLLKRTSTEQSSESANILGKSVEMLTNAIAEMRTYGEGFIIADQAPGLLDLAVIRNTNTKIIMRLPDNSDRELVCRTANLNDDQISEIAKLPCGVAAVYQNDWVQPVLCKVSKFSGATKLYKRNTQDDDYLDDMASEATASLLECIMNRELFGSGNRTEIQRLRKMIIRSELDTAVKKDFIEYIYAEDENAIASLRHLIYRFLSAEKAIKEAAHCNNINDWVQSVVDGFNPSIKEYSKKQIDLVLALVLYEQSLKDSEYNNIFCRFTEIYKVEGGAFR